ncbi:hypothetical protein M758_5G083200 [Ceratodon purpureus]|nr:hypothetical protein M758_5G083200 [Ceratodon purpureus]
MSSFNGWCALGCTWLIQVWLSRQEIVNSERKYNSERKFRSTLVYQHQNRCGLNTSQSGPYILVLVV